MYLGVVGLPVTCNFHPILQMNEAGLLETNLVNYKYAKSILTTAVAISKLWQNSFIKDVIIILNSTKF